MGLYLGLSHKKDDDRLTKARESFDRRLSATIKRFEQLNGGREPTAIELWQKVDPLHLYQAAALWVGESPPNDEQAPLPPPALPILWRLKKAIIDGDLPLADDADNTKQMRMVALPAAMARWDGKPVKIPNDVEVDREGLRTFAKSIDERPAFLFGDDE